MDQSTDFCVEFSSHSAKNDVKKRIWALAIMNNYEDWAQLVARKLKGEADVITAIEKDELDDAAAAEAFVRTVLTPFLPENYGVSAGHIVDAFGKAFNPTFSTNPCWQRLRYVQNTSVKPSSIR
jgi:hypothetical protein